MKRRKLQLNENIAHFDLSKILNSLKGYKQFVEENGEIDDISTSKKHVRTLLKLENRSSLVELLRKYFSVNITDTTIVSYETTFQFDGKKDHYIMSRKKSYEKDELVDLLLSHIQREFEKCHVKELNNYDIRFFKFCGISVPQDIVLIIFSFFSSNSYHLIKTLGRINSSYYLSILTNFNSEVEIRSVKQLYRISILAFQSLKHLSFPSLNVLGDSEFEYIVKNISPNRIVSLCFGNLANFSINSLIQFFKICKKNNIQMRNCKTVYFHKDCRDMFKFKNHKVENGHFKPIDEKLPNDLFSFVIPSVETIWNPCISGRSSFEDIFKQLRKVKNLVFEFEKVAFPEREHVEDTFHDVTKLESILVIAKSNYPKYVKKIESKELLAFEPLYRTCEYDTLSRFTNLGKEHDPEVRTLLGIKELEFSYFCDTNIDLDFLPPNLEILSLRIEMYKSDDLTFRGSSSCKTVVLKSFPQTIRKLIVIDPPIDLLRNIEHFKVLETLEFSMKKKSLPLVGYGRIIFTLDDETENLVIYHSHTFPVIQSFWKYLLTSKSCLVKNIDIIVLDNWKYQAPSDLLQIMVKKNLHKLWLFYLTEKLDSFQDSMIEGVRENIDIVEEIRNNIEEEEEKEDKEDEINKFQVTSVYVCSLARKRKIGLEAEKKIFGEERRKLLSQENQGMKIIDYPNYIFHEVSHFEACVEFRRKRFFVEL